MDATANKQLVGIVIIVICCLGVMPRLSYGGSLDYRHEYKHHTEQHNNRLKLSYSTSAFYYGGFVKFATEKNPDGSQDAFGRIKAPEAMLDVGTKHKINEQWYFRPGIRAGGGKGFHATDLQARLGFNPQGVPLKTYARYRRSIKNYHQSDKKSTVKNKLTLSLIYSHGANKLLLKTNVIRAETKPIYHNKKTDYDYSLGYSRDIQQWQLYLEVAEVSAHSKTATRQVRTRVGVKYNFDK